MENSFTPEALKAKAESAPVVFTKFILSIDKYGKDAVYCFVEGYDMPYYINPVRLIMGKEPVEIKCAGKDNVISANQYIENMAEYNHYTKRYFVDRDYTDNSSLPDSICITEGYAIENYYLVDECIERILKFEFKFDLVENEEAYKKCINLFHDQHGKFEESILLFNSWYCCLREDKSWNHRDVSLDSTFPDEWLKCKIEEINATYSLEEIQSKYPKAPIIPQEVIEEKMKKCREKGWFFMRGKYEMQFLYTFLKFLKDEPSKHRVYSVGPCSIPFYLNTMVSTFSQYAYIPESLRSYIEKGTYSHKN